MSLLFHFLIFVFLLSEVSIIPVQSAPQDYPKILAEVVLLPSRQAGNTGGQVNIGNNTEPVVEVEPQNKTAIKPAESTKPTVPVRKTASAKETAPPKNTAKNNIQDKHEIKTNENKTNTSDYQMGNISSSVSDNRSTHESGGSGGSNGLGGSGNAANGILSSHGSSIAGVDSVIVVNRVKPVYPQISRKRGEEGNVILLASVVKGKVVNVTIEKSSGIKALDASALTAVGKWSFSADTNLTVRIPVSFKLKD